MFSPVHSYTITLQQNKTTKIYGLISRGLFTWCMGVIGTFSGASLKIKWCTQIFSFTTILVFRSRASPYVCMCVEWRCNKCVNLSSEGVLLMCSHKPLQPGSQHWLKRSLLRCLFPFVKRCPFSTVMYCSKPKVRGLLMFRNSALMLVG